MTRHVADRRSTTTGAKTRAFLDLERKDLPHPAVALLARKPQEQAKTTRMVQFLRIERGYRA